MRTKATIVLLATLLLGLSPLAINAQSLDELNYYQLEDGRYVYYEGLVPCGKEVIIGSDALGDYSNLSTVHMACQFCHLFAMLSAIISFLLVQLVPILAVILLVAGGIMYYLALGNPEKLSRANKMLKSTIIGLVIVYGAWMIVGALLTIVGVADWTGLQDGWYTVSCPIKEVGYTIDTRPRLRVLVEGPGKVVSTQPNDLNIDCGLDGKVCSKFVDKDTIVILQAQPDSEEDPQISFRGWGEECQRVGSSPICIIKMDTSKLVTAKFDSPSQRFNLFIGIQAAERGLAGKVTDDHNNTCEYSFQKDEELGKSCLMRYAAGTEVTLTVKPGEGTQFRGWFRSGECDASSDTTCTFVMTKNKQAYAMFEASKQ